MVAPSRPRQESTASSAWGLVLLGGWDLERCDKFFRRPLSAPKGAHGGCRRTRRRRPVGRPAGARLSGGGREGGLRPSRFAGHHVVAHADTAGLGDQAYGVGTGPGRDRR